MTLSVEQRAARVKAIIFDVDGVLTRGEIIHSEAGELKFFDVHDGHGFALARRAGLKLALFSGRESEAVRRRAKELKVDLLREAVLNKHEAIDAVFEKLGVDPEEACYVGDDVVDIPPMRRVGFPVAVATARPEVKEAAVWVTECRGGEGAAREVIELVLKARGLWDSVMERYLEGGK